MPTISAPYRPKLATRGPGRAMLGLGRASDDRLAALAALGDERAFEVIYDRHHRALLGFCRHMVGSREEAEDALQQTFLRAHKSLVEHGPPEDMRPWLFAIARNRCRTLLAARRAEAEIDDYDVAGTDGLGEQVQARADLQAVVADVARLPDDQRAALVLAELGDLSHAQIGEVIGVRAEKVKALIHQARTTLIAEREAREQPCEEVRETLATARGGALRRGPLRRHLRQCAPCRAYRDAVGEQRRALALALPVAPSLGLKSGILGAASTAGGGGGLAGGASFGGGVAAKVVASALAVGTAAGGGAAIVHEVESSPAPRAPATRKVDAVVPSVANPRAGSEPVSTAPAGRRVSVSAGAPSRSRQERREKRGGNRAKKHAREATPFSPPGQSRRELAHARARGQQGKETKLPGSSRSTSAPPKKAHPAKPIKPVKPVKAVKVPKPAKPLDALAPETLTPGQQRRAEKLKTG